MIELTADSEATLYLAWALNNFDNPFGGPIGCSVLKGLSRTQQFGLIVSAGWLLCLLWAAMERLHRMVDLDLPTLRDHPNLNVRAYFMYEASTTSTLATGEFSVDQTIQAGTWGVAQFAAFCDDAGLSWCHPKKGWSIKQIRDTVQYVQKYRPAFMVELEPFTYR